METIAVKHLNFSYKGTNTALLKDISFSVKQGEFVLLCGMSGSGKTTLLKHLKKELIPSGCTEGTMIYKGREISRMSQRESAEKIGFVFQRPENQIVTDKVYSELAFGLENLGVPQKEMQRRVAEMASFFGMGSWFYKENKLLSGGQKQLLNLASVMVMNPQVLILDEPTSQLDPIAAEEFLSIVVRLHRELGITVILAEHRLEHLLPVAHRVLFLEEGCLMADTTPEELAKEAKKLNNRAIFLALPVATQVYLSLGDKTEQMPLSINEGRRWLKEKTTSLTCIEELPAEKKVDAPIILQVKELFYRYEKKGEDILANVNLQVNKGEILSIVGENGSGKTTLLNCMAGLLTPYSGRVLYKGEQVSKNKGKDNYNQKRAVLPQDPTTTFLKDTLEEDLLYVANQWYGPQQAVQKTKEICEALSLSHLKQTHPYDLSGGEAQLLALGKLLLKDPEILFLDECTKGLDALHKEKLKLLLKKLQAKGTTIVSVSHDLEFAADISTSVAFCFKGQLLGRETPRDFFSTNRFYTTAASKLTRDIFSKAITTKDVIWLCQNNL